MERPLVRYEPSPILAWLYQRFFAHIEVDDAWARAVRDADRRGTVVYVLRNLSFVDFFALDHLTKRLELPEVRFANDLRLWILEPMGRGWFNALRPRKEADDVRDLERALAAGSSAALFLKRPASVLDAKARGTERQGDAYIKAIFDAQRAQGEPILLVPQVFVWTKAPDAAKQNVFDVLLGPREWPGQLRSIGQFLANYRHVTLRAGEPLDVKAFLESEAKGQSDDVLVRRLTYVLLRRLERERKAILGPTQKPADRLRAQVVRSPKLQKIIADMAGEGTAEREVITQRALGMLKELEATPDPRLVPPLDTAFTRIFERMYSGIEVDTEGIERLRSAARDGTLVLLPSHKSHVDYLVLAQAFYRHRLPLPLIAAGDNLDFFPVGPIFRRTGAFFIRRSFHGDRLYMAVVDAYIRRLLKDGWPLEFFLEGGRSRTGKLLPPKVGILSIVVDAALGVTNRPVYFCPITIGYERFVEEKAFVHELTGGEKQKEDMRGLLSTANVVAQRYGRLNIQFGELLTLPQVLRELHADAKPEDLAKMTPARRRAVITRLAHRVMNEINRVTAVTPGALVATALLATDKRGVPHADLLATCEMLAGILHGFGARFSPTLAHPTARGAIRRGAVIEAIDLFLRAGHVEAHRPGTPSRERRIVSDDAVYVVPAEARLSLDLSKNIVVHFFASRALVATAMSGDSVPSAALKERVQALSRLLKYEFSFRADATFDQIYEDEIAAMTAAGELRRAGDAVAVSSPSALKLYASIVKSFIEGYRVAARGLAPLLKGALASKDLVKRAMPAGERMFLAGDIERREAVSRPLLENAYEAFVDQGYLRRESGKLALTDSYVSEDALRTIEARIAGYLAR
jgi:glycerol-3-phosphate O-acyltransferase